MRHGQVGNKIARPDDPTLVKEWQKEVLIGLAGGLFVGLVILLLNFPGGIPMPGR